MRQEAPLNFYGDLPEEGRKEPLFVMLPVPYEATTSYARGTSHGPRAILEASTQVELYDEEVDLEPWRVGVETAPMLDFKGLAPSEAMQRIEDAVSKIAKQGRIPFMLGGEHSITPPAVRGVGSVHPDITVVQIDAHADLRDSYEGSTFSHASAMARVREDGYPAVQVGIRSLSVEEAHLAKEKQYPIYYAHQLTKGWMQRSVQEVKTEKVYLTIDIDAFDSSIMPDTGTPEPGGMTWRDVTGFVRMLMKQKRVVGLDLVELMPQPGRHASDFFAARLASKCLAYWAEGSR